MISETSYRRNKADELLRLLMEQPRSTRDLVVLHGHRFSASKRVLVERGWEINTWTNDAGERMWALGPHSPRVEVTDEMQAAYYQTPHWRSTRLKRLALDNHKCVLCPMRMGLEVHHWQYDLFAENVEHLATLCKGCHGMIHAMEGVSIHFPHFVTPDIAARIWSEGQQ